MLTVISPAKKLDYESDNTFMPYTQPLHLEDSQCLMDELRHLSADDLSQLMHISKDLGILNHERNQNWSLPFDLDNAKQAILAFKGDVYEGMQASSFTDKEMDWAQSRLRILSGLYGTLRPLDLMQPYRLEMGTRFKNQRGANLYSFWGDEITTTLNKQLESIDSEILVNLASTEYFKSVKIKKLNAQVITPIFKDQKGDIYKIISFYAKKARGSMAAWLIKNEITDVSDITGFNVNGYYYSADDSTDNEIVFLREA